MTIIPEATIEAHNQAGRILHEFLNPGPSNFILEPLKGDSEPGGLKLTIKTALPHLTRRERWYFFAIDRDGRTIHDDKQDISYEMVCE